jgi:transcription termination factor NusB
VIDPHTSPGLAREPLQETHNRSQIITWWTGSKEQNTMEEAHELLVKLATGFDKIATHHEAALTHVQEQALSHKAQCEQLVTDISERFQALADTVQPHLDNVRGMMSELRPLNRKVQQLEKKQTKKGRKKATA